MDGDNFIDNYEHMNSQLFYSSQNVPGPGCDKDMFESQLCVQCDCTDFCGVNCKCLSRTGVNYLDGILLEEKLSVNSFGVIECNYLCSCHKKCGNRLVQYGPISDLEIFSDEVKGFGLKCLKPLRKGDFICEYSGEVIGKSEAKLRAKNSNDTMNYIFLLKEHFGESFTETVVDPTCIGNIGRYINHSCGPNAAIVPVRYDSLVPHLAIFAVDDIVPGEEISFDYSGGDQDNFLKGFNLKTCHCNTSKCRKFIPFHPDLL